MIRVVKYSDWNCDDVASECTRNERILSGRAAAFFTLLRRAGTHATACALEWLRLYSAPLRKGDALHRVRDTRTQKGRPGVTPDGLLCDCRLKLRFRRDGSRLQRLD